MSASCSREHQRVDAPHPVKRSSSLIPAENNPPKPSPTPALRRLVLAATFACRLTGIFSGTRERFGGRWRHLFFCRSAVQQRTVLRVGATGSPRRLWMDVAFRVGHLKKPPEQSQLQNENSGPACPRLDDTAASLGPSQSIERGAVLPSLQCERARGTPPTGPCRHLSTAQSVPSSGGWRTWT